MGEDADDECQACGRPYSRSKCRKTIVLCFDGTGNKFRGNDGDSNILKIYSLLKRDNSDHHVYYQPGIGTYVQGSSLSKSGRFERVKSAYLKAKDQALGISFDSHVMDGYRFLMRFYTAGDNIYMFGFSRGAYTARFLAQMLDYVGLLQSGNEEMVRFAWKTFSHWQSRTEETEQEKKEKAEQYDFMRKFRDTFARPVRRIRFLGLFDTVNSVPRFEGAWMSRGSRFPYTSRSSAKVIRHAVSIDEHRAKFRQDLCTSQRPGDSEHHHHHLHDAVDHFKEDFGLAPHEKKESKENGEKKPQIKKVDSFKPRFKPQKSKHLHTDDGRTNRFSVSDQRRHSVSAYGARRDTSHAPTTSSIDSGTILKDKKTRHEYDDSDDEDDEEAPQDIQEVWFSGDHADIGGGWWLSEGEETSVSLIPLIWMLREARKAGLPFNEDALVSANYVLPDKPSSTFHDALPTLQVDGEPYQDDPEPSGEDKERRDHFLKTLHSASTKATVHDSLRFGGGLPSGSSLAWKVMEYMPFRRMDLQPDGSWAPIRWPLPFGEPRDIPRNAWIHHTVLKRMEANEKYRPGNLIVGGGGRGILVAPEEYGTGKWRVLQEEGDPVGEVVVRARKAPTEVEMTG